MEEAGLGDQLKEKTTLITPPHMPMELVQQAIEAVEGGRPAPTPFPSPVKKEPQANNEEPVVIMISG